MTRYTDELDQTKLNSLMKGPSSEAIIASELTAQDVVKAIAVCVGIHKLTDSKLEENDEVRKTHQWFTDLTQGGQPTSLNVGIKDVQPLITVYELYRAIYWMFLKQNPVNDEPAALEAGEVAPDDDAEMDLSPTDLLDDHYLTIVISLTKLEKQLQSRDWLSMLKLWTKF